MKEKLMASINYIICIVSGVVAIVLMFLPLLTYTTNIGLYQPGESFNFIGLMGEMNFFVNTDVAMLSGIFCIVALVLAVLLIVVGVMMLLKIFGVFDWKLDSKISDFNLMLDAVASIFAVFTFGVYLTLLFFKNANNDLNNFFPNVTPAAVCLFVIPLVLCLAMWGVDAYKEAQAKKAQKVEAPKAE